MKKDVVITFILSAFSTIAALVCAAIVSAENHEYSNKGFTISDEEFSITTAGWH